MKPIAWYDPTNGMVSTDKDSPLFTPLGQVWALYLPRTWTGLTDEDLEFLFPHGKSVWLQETVKIIEAKLKEKNA